MFGTIWGNDTISRKSKTVLTIGLASAYVADTGKVMLAIGVIGLGLTLIGTQGVNMMKDYIGAQKNAH